MTLTKEEIHQIQFELRNYSHDVPFCDGYQLATTKYLPQLKAERERAGKLAETMLEIATYCPSAETCVIAKEAYEKYNNKNTITNHEKTNNSSMPDDCAGGGGAVPDIPNPST